MLLTLIRTKWTRQACMGILLVDGQLFCHTLEPPLTPNQQHPKGAIPMGYYKLTLTFSPRFKRVLPLLHMVPGFEGVRIHAGNQSIDSQGCILVGELPPKDKRTRGEQLVDARITERALVDYLRDNTAKNEEIFLDITNRERFYSERMQSVEQYLRSHATAPERMESRQYLCA